MVKTNKKKQSLEQSVESISLKEFYHSFKDKLLLSEVIRDQELTRFIREKSVNRPALALTGYFRHFASKRLQLFGAGEMAYLRSLSESVQEKILSQIAQKNIPCMIISRNLTPTRTMVKVAEKFKIPLFRTPMKSKDFSAEVTVLLEDKMAPRTTLHGTFLDIRGIGTILCGKSGIGKSECALGLVERGHSLITDDVVHIKLLAERELRGSGPEMSRGYLECRGIGIINVPDLFGIRAFRLEKRVDLIITFKEWTPGMAEERTGLDQDYMTILKRRVPHIEIPVRPGRDMTRLVEVAAMTQALRQAGHDPAKKFNEGLIEFIKYKKQKGG